MRQVKTKGWNEKKKEYEEELKPPEEIKARTVDMLRVGEVQPGRDHNFVGEKTNTQRSIRPQVA